jgi:hypothetical protein
MGAATALVFVWVVLPRMFSSPAATTSSTTTTSTFTFTLPPASSRSAPNATAASELPPSGAPRFSAGDPAYSEPGETCDALADVGDLDAAYRPEAMRAAAEGLARVRYPDGLAFIEAQDDKMLAAWLEGEPKSFHGVAARFDTAVHEGSHVWVAKHFDPLTVSYPVRADLTIRTKRLKNFDRAAIMPLRTGLAEETYAATYLTGQSGAQGFNTLLDEYDAYTHGLASRYCTRDLLDANERVSARDGILAMMYYVGLYLRLAREKYPADYAAILADPGHRRMILTVWDRAELWLRRSAPYASLGVRDAEIEPLAYSAEGLAELARVRDADGGGGGAP